MELVRSKKPTTFPVHPVSCWTRHAQWDLIQTLLWQNRILKEGQLLPWSKRGEREDGVWPSARGAWAQALCPRDLGSRLRIWLSVPVPTPSGCKRRSIPGRGTKILQAKKIKRQIKFSSVRLHEQERTQLWEIKPVYLERILSRKRCFLDPRGHRPVPSAYCLHWDRVDFSREQVTTAGPCQGSSHVLSWIRAPCLPWDLGPPGLRTSLVMLLPILCPVHWPRSGHFWPLSLLFLCLKRPPVWVQWLLPHLVTIVFSCVQAFLVVASGGSSLVAVL